MKMNPSNETKVFSIHTEKNDGRFGFTLAGQYPCQLVKIQEGSPAEKAGLKSGDEILEVNGVNVEDLKHDCVASFITPSPNGTTELRIRRITASPQTLRISGQNVHKSVSEDLSCSTSTAYLSNVVDRVVEEFKRPAEPGSASLQQRKGLDPRLFYGCPADIMASDEQLRASFTSPDSSTTNTAVNISTRPPRKTGQKVDQMAEKPCKMEAVVGYLGSIERPTARREPNLFSTHIRTRTTPPVYVLLEVSPSRLYVKNSNKQVLMTCETKSLIYVGICPDNKQVLGLFTGTAKENAARSVEDDTAQENTDDCSSEVNLDCTCHLFVIDARLIRHLNHKCLTDRFQLLCVPDPNTGSCQQFPTSSRAILNTLSVILRGSLVIRTPNESHRDHGIPPNSTKAADLNAPKHICEAGSCGNDYTSSSVGNSSESTQAADNISENGRNDDEADLVLCLHLYSLVHTGLPSACEMNYRTQGDYSVGNGEFNYSSATQNSCSITSHVTSTTTESRSTTQSYSIQNGNEVTTAATTVSQEGKCEQQQGRTSHKTLLHRRSQSLVGDGANVINMLQPCPTALAQSFSEHYSQSGFRFGNNGRPVYHSSSSSVLACKTVNNVDGKVARWALAFDKLLEDKIGLNIFRSFLRKEYSEENLIFWLACEKYKTIKDEAELKKEAEGIFETHLKSCATLPVNVESSAIRGVEEQLDKPTEDLFTTLQYQIYTLMKFDSYARFLKSDLYRQCWVDELEGRPLPVEDETKKVEEGSSTLRRMVKLLHSADANNYLYLGCDPNDKNSQFGSSTKTKGWKTLHKAQSASASTSEAEENKKKSFLPWRGRLKSEPKKPAPRSSDSQASSARSSLSSLSDSVFSANITNSDEALNDSDGKDQAPPTCRVILPNGALMFLFCKSTRSLKEGLSRLCENKEYSLPALDLFIGDHKLTKDDLLKKLTRFINKEIVLKQRILFRLLMPTDRIVGVKAEAEKTVAEVLEPILRDANLDINNVVIRMINNQQQLNKDSPVLSLHQNHVVVETTSSEEVRRPSESSVKSNGSKLNNEIVLYNPKPVCEEDKVFDALMSGKRQSISGFSFDENGVFAPLIKLASSKELLSVKEKDKTKGARSPALFRKKKREVTQSASTFKTFLVEDEKKDTEEFLTLLRRSQKSRLDDQRGILDKKVELPDFLKLPEKPPTKRNTVLDVGVPSPRPQHQLLTKTLSSPPACSEPDTTKQTTKSLSSTIVERPMPPERSASAYRNWSGSLRIRGRTHVETATRIVTETQTIDRRHFSRSNSTNVTTANRVRAESLQHERSDERETGLGNELRNRSRNHYQSETSMESKTDDVVWVSSPVPFNRRRGNSRVGHYQNGGNGTKKTEENPGNAEVIIPDMNYNTERFPITGGVVPFFDRPKPITDSKFFRDFLEAAKLEMPTTAEATSKAPDLESASDREAILDNSFLRDQLKPSRLFSQLTPESSPSVETPSQGRKQSNSEAAKCPLFIPPSFRITADDDDTAGNTNPAGSTHNTRHEEEESVRVTFV